MIMEDFDIFQTVGSKDFSIIKYTLGVNKKNIIGYKNFYLFNENLNFSFPDISNVDASFFPFTIDYVAKNIENKSRAGWIYAQLAKIYFPYLQTNSENVLVVDSDVFFTKHTKFFDSSNKPFFTTSDEFHEPYFLHMLRVHPDFKRVSKKSGISHHMLFNKELVGSMIKKVEEHHQKNFFDVYLEQIDGKENSPSADYEIYFHYVVKNYKTNYSIRELKWKNVSKLTQQEYSSFEMLSLPHYSGTRPSDILKNLKKRKIIRFVKSIQNFIFLKTRIKV